MYKNSSIFKISKMDAYYLSCSSVNTCVPCGRESYVFEGRRDQLTSLLATIWILTTLSPNSWKSHSLMHTLFHILKAVRFPQMASKLKRGCCSFQREKWLWGTGNCHSFCTILELMSAPRWLLNLSLGWHLFIFTWIFKQFCEQSF